MPREFIAYNLSRRHELRSGHDLCSGANLSIARSSHPVPGARHREPFLLRGRPVRTFPCQHFASSKRPPLCSIKECCLGKCPRTGPLSTSFVKPREGVIELSYWTPAVSSRPAMSHLDVRPMRASFISVDPAGDRGRAMQGRRSQERADHPST